MNWKFVRKSAALFCSLFLLICLQLQQDAKVSAQGSDQFIRIPIRHPVYLAWAADSRHIILNDGQASPDNIFLNSAGWSQYDIQTQTLTPLDGFPLLPKLTAREAAVFKLTKPDGTDNDTQAKTFS